MLGFNMTHSQKLSSADLFRLRFECNFISILSWIVSPHLKACKTTNWKMEWLWRGYPPEESILDTANCTLCFLQWNELRNGNLFLHRGWKRGMSIAARGDGTSGCCKLLFNGKPCWNSEIQHMIGWCKLPKITMTLIFVRVVPSVVPVLAGPAQDHPCATGVPLDRAEQLPLSTGPLWRYFILQSSTVDNKKWIL